MTTGEELDHDPLAGELRLFDDPLLIGSTPVGRRARRHRRQPFTPPFAEPTVATEPSSSTEPTGDIEPSGEPFTVVVERSAKRRRTVGAQLVGDVLKIVVPSWMSRSEQDHWVEVMSGRFRRKLSTDRIDLRERAAVLARRHDLPHPTEIRWSDDMHSRWGSCTPSTGTIRISSRIARFPDWVIDYVLVHELAHLEVGDHSESFWRLVRRYQKAERAIGYLIAKSGDGTDAD